MGINWKIRLKNPMFYVQIILSVIMPVLAYMGKTAQDITSWALLGAVMLEAVKNPYILALVAVSVWNAINDPTTKGMGDGIPLSASKKHIAEDYFNGDK